MHSLLGRRTSAEEESAASLKKVTNLSELEQKEAMQLLAEKARGYFKYSSKEKGLVAETKRVPNNWGLHKCLNHLKNDRAVLNWEIVRHLDIKGNTASTTYIITEIDIKALKNVKKETLDEIYAKDAEEAKEAQMLSSMVRKARG